MSQRYLLGRRAVQCTSFLRSNGLIFWYDLLCDVSTFGNRHAVVDDSRELSKAANLFSKCWRRQTILARRELEIVVKSKFMELPCCTNTA